MNNHRLLLSTRNGILFVVFLSFLVLILFIATTERTQILSSTVANLQLNNILKPIPICKHYGEEKELPNKCMETKAALELEYMDIVLKNQSLINFYDNSQFRWDLFEPTADCTAKNRIGRRGDGGKWLCNPDTIVKRRKPNPCVVYSFGLYTDVGFELDMHSTYQCHTYSFDPDPMSMKSIPPQLKPGMEYYPLGLGAKSVGATKTLWEVLDKLNHTYIDFLKMDIELSEIPFFKAILADERFTKLQISQILAELHGPPGVFGVSEFITIFKGMHNAGYRVYSKEANLICGPMCTEYAWIHKSYLNYE